MQRISTLWKANAIAFISSFCVMVVELIAGRILAPHIGVSLYTWTSIIGVILAGIALGNYLGGRIADKYPSPLLLAAIFFIGGLLTIAILPTTKIVTSYNWFGNLPIVWNFVLKTSFIFFLPAIILSMVSPLVIKLTLANLGKTGGVVGTIYACSTAGSILGTFLTGFYFILWFGTQMIIWVVAAVLLSTGIMVWFSWRVKDRWKLSLKNFITWTVILGILVTYILLFQHREALRAQAEQLGEEIYVTESSYFTIRVFQINEIRALCLDTLIQSFIVPEEPTALKCTYLDTFEGIVSYVTRENLAPRILHLGGGGYSFPRYMEFVYPGSVNEVVEIDPMVTQVAHEKLNLPRDTSIKTYNQDARLFLIQRKTGTRYNVIIGDVFNDRSTPYHLTTLEFNNLVKANLEEDGIYLVNIIDSYGQERYMPAFVHTLRQTFQYVYLFGNWAIYDQDLVRAGTFVIAATDHSIDLPDYKKFIVESGRTWALLPMENVQLDNYLAQRNPILLTDDYAPTDILVAPLFK